MLAGEKKKWAIFEGLLPVFHGTVPSSRREAAPGSNAGREGLTLEAVTWCPPFPAGHSLPLWQAGVTHEVGLLHEGNA